MLTPPDDIFIIIELLMLGRMRASLAFLPPSRKRVLYSVARWDSRRNGTLGVWMGMEGMKGLPVGWRVHLQIIISYVYAVPCAGGLAGDDDATGRKDLSIRPGQTDRQTDGQLLRAVGSTVVVMPAVGSSKRKRTRATHVGWD